MKTLIMMYGLDEEKLGLELFERLVNIYPEAKGKYSFPNIGLDGDDPRSQQVLDCLLEHGFSPSNDLGLRGETEFGMNLVRQYDSHDLEQASYLVLTPAQFLGSNFTTTATGVVQIPQTSAAATSSIGHIDYGRTLVSQKINEALLKEDMRHLVLRETVALDDDLLTAEEEKAFWELTSDLTLPPLSPTMYKVDKSGKMISGANGEEYLLREGLSIPDVLYRPPELRYTSASFSLLPAFDVALTLERAGGGNSQWRSLIVSQRMYQFCTKHSLQIDWQPVRIEK